MRKDSEMVSLRSVIETLCYMVDEDSDGVEEVMQLPTIDLVRCKECKYEPICSHSVQHTTHEPTAVTIGYKSVDYCSYGERKESE